MSEEAICSRCHSTRPLRQFPLMASKRNGVSSWCKQCKAENEKERRQRPEAKAKYNAWKRKRRNENREATNAKNRAWKAAHPESHRAWRRNNPEKVRAQLLKDNAKRKGRLANVPSEEWCAEEIIERDGLVCYLCCKTLQRGEVTIDHKIPISRDGPNMKFNLGVACKPCNSRKADRTPEEYLRGERFPRHQSPTRKRGAGSIYKRVRQSTVESVV